MQGEFWEIPNEGRKTNKNCHGQELHEIIAEQ